MKLNITEKFSALINKSNLFYRFTRYCYGVDSILQKHKRQIIDSQTNKVGVYSALKNSTQNLITLSNQYNWFSRRLLGLNDLISKYQSLITNAEQQRDDLFFKTQKNNALKFKSTISVKTTISTFASLNQHLQQKSTFIQNIKKPDKPALIPYEFEHFGRNNQISARTFVSTGKPMTYQNLQNEYKENRRREDQCRPTLRKYCNTSDSFLWHEASDKVDGCLSAQRYIEKHLKSLHDQAPVVEINESTMKPEVKVIAIKTN